jgi:hypothetical protein
MPGDGMFVLGDIAVPNVDFPIGDVNQLQNGTATLLLIENFDAFNYPQGFDIDIDNDGMVDEGVELGDIIDGVGFVDAGVDEPEPEVDRVYFDVTVLGPHGSEAPAGGARRTDGLDTESPTDFCQLGEAGDGTDGFAVPTPGMPNACSTCALPGDGNDDGAVDLLDYGRLQECFTGAQAPADPPLYPDSCRCLDFDADGDIDLADYTGLHGQTHGDTP